MGIVLSEETLKTINIDKIFPIKDYLYSEALENKSIYVNNKTEYINCPIAFYGGGYNLNSINITNDELKSNLSKEIKINLVNKYLSLDKTEQTSTQVKYLMMKAVTVTTGNEPFKFICFKDNGYLFNETPNVKELRKNN